MQKQIYIFFHLYVVEHKACQEHIQEYYGYSETRVVHHRNDYRGKIDKKCYEHKFI